MKQTKSRSIRFDIDNYEYIRSMANASNRSMSGQANWICRLLMRVQKEHPEIFNEISNNLQHEVFK